MERAEKVGLGLAAAGHVVLFGLLSVGFLATPNPLKLRSEPVEVSLVPEVAVESAAPEPAAESAQSVAPEEGPPEDAAPPAPAEAPPEPVPPQPVPPPPAPVPAPKPQPAPPKPAPAPKAAPAPKPQPKPPAPRPAQPKAAPRPAPAKAAPAQPKAAPARPAASKGTGSTQTASAARPRGSRLGDDFLRGLSAEPSRSTNTNPPAARIGAQALANIAAAIQRQIQPCANRQVTPGPGAERIRVAINLRLNRDGSLASRPTVRGHTGVDDDNRRYVDRVDDLAIAAFTGCAPLRGLPPELYDVPGGWSNFTLRYKLPG